MPQAGAKGPWSGLGRGFDGITPWSRQPAGGIDSAPMNQKPFCELPPESQLDLFDIVPDTPLPPPRFFEDPADEPHMEWLQRQSEDGLRIFLQILESTPGFRRS